MRTEDVFAVLCVAFLLTVWLVCVTLLVLRRGDAPPPGVPATELSEER